MQLSAITCGSAVAMHGVDAAQCAPSRQEDPIAVGRFSRGYRFGRDAGVSSTVSSPAPPGTARQVSAKKGDPPDYRARKHCILTRGTTIERRRAILRDAVRLIEAEHRSRNLTVEHVAHHVATSPRQLQRCFTELSDETFSHCVQRVRLERAAQILRVVPRAPIRVVAGHVGYSQPAHFAKTFRSRYGVTPREYRAAAQAAA